MQAWEYRVVIANSSVDKEPRVSSLGRELKIPKWSWYATFEDGPVAIGLEAICNQMGAQGWELVAPALTYQSQRADQITLFFKRPQGPR